MCGCQDMQHRAQQVRYFWKVVLVSWIEFLDRNLIHTTTMSDIINTQFEYVCFDRWLGYDVR